MTELSYRLPYDAKPLFRSFPIIGLNLACYGLPLAFACGPQIFQAILDRETLKTLGTNGVERFPQHPALFPMALPRHRYHLVTPVFLRQLERTIGHKQDCRREARPIRSALDVIADGDVRANRGRHIAQRAFIPHTRN